MIRQFAGTVAVLAVIFLASGSAQQPPPRPVDDAALATPEARQQDWLSYGRDYYEQRFSPLDADQRHATSRKLGLAWQFDTATDRGLEATPIVVDGVMYTTGVVERRLRDRRAHRQAALEVRPPGAPQVRRRCACCDVVNRGVAVLQGQGVSSARSTAGWSRSTPTSGKVAWQTTTVDQTQPYTITGAPRIVKGKVIIGNGGAEYGVRGYVRPTTPRPGKLAWRFYTVPGDPSKPQENTGAREGAADVEGHEWWKVGGGGTVWDSIAYDPELDLLYVGTGNGSPWNRDLRSPGGGDNLYLSSILAISPDNGELVWHYQTTPGDTWDYTSMQPMMLADLDMAGRAAQGDHAGAEERLLLRARSRHRRAALGRSVRGSDLGDARRPEDRTPRRSARRGVQGQGHLHSPRPARRAQLAGDVVQPAHRPGLHSGAGQRPLLRATQGASRSCRTEYNLGVAPIGRNLDRYDIPYKGRLLAWDPVARKPRWTVEYGNYWNGGTLATAGNLVFQGTASGDFFAYRATDGQKLWSSWAGTGIVAPPITYMIDGRQYVSVMAGWGGAFSKKARSYGRLLTFAIGGTAALPSRPRPRTVTAIAHSGTPRADRGRREDLHHLLRALPRRRDDTSRSPPIDTGHLHRARKDSRRLARRSRHAALCGTR